MTTPVETVLREGLRDLAAVPGPRGLADEALARAARLRRRRIALAGVGAVALAGMVAVPAAQAGLGTTPFGAGGSDSGSCKTVTDETDPAQGVPRAQWPEFVSVAVSKMPPRADYTLQSGFGVCPQPGGRGVDELAYAVINLGPERQHGHVTISLLHLDATSCATLPAHQAPLLFCEEPSATTPLVFGLDFGSGSVAVTAVYPDRRAVAMESNQSPIGKDAMKAVVTDRALADLFS